MDKLEQRLRNLERDFQRSRRANRYLVLAVVIIACVASARVATPQTSKPMPPSEVSSKDASVPNRGAVPAPARARTIEAEQFVLLDKAGRSRVRMASTDDGPSISMFDEHGKKRLELCSSSRSTGLRVMDSDESPVVSLQLPRGDGRAHLEFHSAQGSSLTKADGFSVLDAAGQSRLQLALLNGDFPLLGISQSGQDGPPSIEMTASDGSRSWKIHDEAGHALFSIFSDERDSTSISLRHPGHERLLQISTGTEEVDGPTIALFAPANDSGHGGQLPLVQIGLRKDRQPYIRIVDSDGRSRFSAPGE